MRHSNLPPALKARGNAMPERDRAAAHRGRGGGVKTADSPAQTYCPVCERQIKTNARGLLHRHKAGTDHHISAEVCPGSGQPAVDEATIIAAAAERRRQALRKMSRSK
jgi:hypothetical protein